MTYFKIYNGKDYLATYKTDKIEDIKRVLQELYEYYVHQAYHGAFFETQNHSIEIISPYIQLSAYETKL